jgi:cytochrome oxidase Cu insertion factor (SCO1/SenC/PrrC family)
MSKIARGKAMWLLVSVLVLLGLVALMQGGDTPPAGAQPPSAPKFTRKVMVDNSVGAEINARFAKDGAILLAEYATAYGNSTLWRITEEQAATLLAQRGLLPGVSFVEQAEYTAIDEPLDNIPANLRQTKIDGYQIWQIKYVGPYKSEWKQALRDMGIKRVSNSWVWVTGKQIDQLEALAASQRSFIEWAGPVHPAKRLRVGLPAKDSPNLAYKYLKANFMFYDHPQVDETIAHIKALAQPVPYNATPMPNYVRITLSVPLSELENIAHWPDLYLIEPWSDIAPSDEVQDQLVAGNIVTTPPLKGTE